MHRGPRISALLLAGTLLATAGSAALAQSNVVAPPPPPREDTIGPEQLRGFSLGGQREEPATAAQPASEAPAQTPSRPVATDQRTEAPTGQAAPASSARAQSAPSVAPGPSAPAETAARSTGAPPAAPQVSTDLPPATPAPATSFDFGAPSLPSPSGVDTAPLTGAPTRAPIWPWLLALAVVLVGGLFLLKRRRSSRPDGEAPALAFAGGAPAPAPAPAQQPQRRQAPAAAPVPSRPAPAASPAPAPAAAPPPGHPKGVGIVSTRLRPWLDIDIAIASAVLTEEELQLHLRLVIVNSGSTPARQVGVEVVALNAGPEQEKELAAYFGRPDPEPRAADLIAPLDQIVLQSVVRMPRSAFREYAVGDGRAVVPLVALNASYRAGSSSGRTSTAFLVGRGKQESEKLGPLRTDQGPRQFSGVVARPLNIGIRR